MYAKVQKPGLCVVGELCLEREAAGREGCFQPPPELTTGSLANEACTPPAGHQANCMFAFKDSKPLGLGNDISVKVGLQWT